MATTEYIYDGGKGLLSGAKLLQGEVFKTDPVINYLLYTLPDDQRLQYIPKFIGVLLNAAAKNGGRFDEAWTRPRSGNEAPQCSSVWVPPGKNVDSLRSYVSMDFVGVLMKAGVSGVRRMLGDFQAESNKAKKIALVNSDGSKIEKYGYLFFIATDREERGKGLSSTIIRNYQAECKKDGIAILLDSTTEQSHRLYQRLGFRDVRSWHLGVGEVDENGKKQADGRGVQVRAMVWRPEEGNEK